MGEVVSLDRRKPEIVLSLRSKVREKLPFDTMMFMSWLDNSQPWVRAFVRLKWLYFRSGTYFTSESTNSWVSEGLVNHVSLKTERDTWEEKEVFYIFTFLHKRIIAYACEKEKDVSNRCKNVSWAKPMKMRSPDWSNRSQRFVTVKDICDRGVTQRHLGALSQGIDDVANSVMIRTVE